MLLNPGHRRAAGNNSPWIWRGEYMAVSELLPERFTESEIKKDDKRKATKPILSIAS